MTPSGRAQGVWESREVRESSLGVELGHGAVRLWQSELSRTFLDTVADSVQSIVGRAELDLAATTVDRLLVARCGAHAEGHIPIIGTTRTADVASAAAGNAWTLAEGLGTVDLADPSTELQCVVVAATLALADDADADVGAFLRMTAAAMAIGHSVNTLMANATGVAASQLAGRSGAFGAAAAGVLSGDGDATAVTSAMGLMGSCVAEPMAVSAPCRLGVLADFAADAVLAVRLVEAGMTVNPDALDSGRGLLHVLGSGAGGLPRTISMADEAAHTDWLRGAHWQDRAERDRWPLHGSLRLVHASGQGRHA